MEDKQLILSYCRDEFILAVTTVAISNGVSLIAVHGFLLIDYKLYNDYGLAASFYIVRLSYPESTLIWFPNYFLQGSCAAVEALFRFTYIAMGLLFMHQPCLLVDMSLIQVKRLNDIICNQSTVGDTTKVSDQIKIVIEATRQTQEWREEIQNMMRVNFLSEVLGLTFLCGAGLFMISSKPSESLLIITITGLCLCQLFSYCWMGNRFNTRIEELTQKLYGIEWYAMTIKQQKDLQLIIAMSQNMRGYNGIFFGMSFDIFQQVRENFVITSNL